MKLFSELFSFLKFFIYLRKKCDLFPAFFVESLCSWFPSLTDHEIMGTKNPLHTHREDLWRLSRAVDEPDRDFAWRSSHLPQEQNVDTNDLGLFNFLISPIAFGFGIVPNSAPEQTGIRLKELTNDPATEHGEGPRAETTQCDCQDDAKAVDDRVSLAQNQDHNHIQATIDSPAVALNTAGEASQEAMNEEGGRAGGEGTQCNHAEHEDPVELPFSPGPTTPTSEVKLCTEDDNEREETPISTVQNESPRLRRSIQWIFMAMGVADHKVQEDSLSPYTPSC